MHKQLHHLRPDWLKWLLAIALGILYLQLRATGSSDGQSRIDTALRNDDYPGTHINTVHIDLTSPNHWVRISWTGPNANQQENGPFHSAPGKGMSKYDCNDPVESNRPGSCCTPKGVWKVEGFDNHLPSLSACKYVTWFHLGRSIAIHSHPNVPNYPASSGCVRLDEHAAKLIHNNSIAGVTKVIVDGTWTPPPRGGL